MTGIELIAQERQRQIDKGYDSEHDLIWDYGQLLSGVIRYIVLYHPFDTLVHVYKPFMQLHVKMWKAYPNNRIKELSIAGALIAAEIDRLQAFEGKENDR